MAKAKKIRKSTRLISRRATPVIIMSLLSVFILGFFAQQKYQERREKQLFSELDQAIASFSEKTERELGFPAQKETKGYCTHTGEKFKKGRLYCGIRTGGNYVVSSSDEAKGLTMKLEAILGQEPFRAYKEGRQSLLSSAWYKNGTVLMNGVNINCSIGLAYEASTENDVSKYIGDPRPGTFSYLIRCTDFSSKEHYPLGY